VIARYRVAMAASRHYRESGDHQAAGASVRV